MRQREVVTCFLRHGGRILVLRRSQRVGTHRDKWAGVSGSVEAGAAPLEQAYRELREETGLTEADVQLLRQGAPLEIPDPEYDTLWRVHPFLFEVHDPLLIRLDWEHVEGRWVEPSELSGMVTVPRLKETWDQLWKT